MKIVFSFFVSQSFNFSLENYVLTGTYFTFFFNEHSGLNEHPPLSNDRSASKVAN